MYFLVNQSTEIRKKFDCYVGMPSHGNEPFLRANMMVLDVPQYEHFDDEEYPESSSYLMYGDKNDAFLFHIPTKNPDFLQVITFMNEHTQRRYHVKKICSS